MDQGLCNLLFLLDLLVNAFALNKVMLWQECKGDEDILPEGQKKINPAVIHLLLTVVCPDDVQMSRLTLPPGLNPVKKVSLRRFIEVPRTREQVTFPVLWCLCIIGFD